MPAGINGQADCCFRSKLYCHGLRAFSCFDNHRKWKICCVACFFSEWITGAIQIGQFLGVAACSLREQQNLFPHHAFPCGSFAPAFWYRRASLDIDCETCCSNKIKSVQFSKHFVSKNFLVQKIMLHSLQLWSLTDRSQNVNTKDIWFCKW